MNKVQDSPCQNRKRRHVWGVCQDRGRKSQHGHRHWQGSGQLLGGGPGRNCCGNHLGLHNWICYKVSYDTQVPKSLNLFSIIRFSNHARVLEPLFVFTMAYLSYLTAEIFHMSGILAITFCGITMKNYVERNVATKSQTTIKYAIKMLSSSSETIIFMFLGVATIHDNHNWNWWFVTFTIIFCTLFRFDVNYFKLLSKSHSSM